MGFWEEAAKADITTERGVYVSAGFDGVLKILRTFIHEGRAGIQTLVAEFEVVTSNTTNHPVGTTVSWARKPSTLSTPRELRALVVAATNDTDNVDAQVLKASFERDLLKGKTLRLRTQKALKSDFTVHYFSPVV